MDSRGTQIRNFDGTTATKEPQAGDLLLVAKAADIPWFDKANWSAFPAIPAESLPALIKRVHSNGPETRVLHNDAAMTPEYVWHDWRNCDARQNLLVPSGTAVADGPTKDLDPTAVTFVGGENVFLPLKALKQQVLNAAPGTPGGTAPTATADVSDSDFEKLRNILRAIENAIRDVENVRQRAACIQAKCTRGLKQLQDLRDLGGTNTDLASDVHPVDDQGRKDFVQAMEALIDKATPALTTTPYETLEPTLSSNDMPNALAVLHTLVTQDDTRTLLAKVVPVKGEIPWVVGDEPGDSAKTKCTIAHICELAATCAYWFAECDTHDRSDPLLGAAMNAMIGGAAPTSGATSLIDFAAAIPFYPDPALLEPAGTAPEACCGVLTQIFVALKTHESLGAGDGSIATDALDKVADAQGTVLKGRGWLSWAEDFRTVEKAGFKAWKVMRKAYERAVLGKDSDGDVGAQPDVNAAADLLQQGLVFTVKRSFPPETVAKALEALDSMDTPSSKLTDQFSTVGSVFDKLGGFGTLGSLALSLAGGAATAAQSNDFGDGTARAGKAGVDAVKDTLKSLSDLKVVSGLEAKQFALVLGHVSLMFGVAIELCAVVDAASAHDVVAQWGHGLLAGSSLVFLLAPVVGGPVGAILVVLGAGLVVAGEAVVLVHSGVLDTDIQKAFPQVFPSDTPSGSFEHEFASAFQLSSEIAAVKAAFAKWGKP